MSYYVASIFLFLIANLQAQSILWNANNYPNPTTDDGFLRCRMQSTALICDPDGVINETNRHHINYELEQFELRTRGLYRFRSKIVCKQKGITAGLALARRVGYAKDTDNDMIDEQLTTVQLMASEFEKRWMLDVQCQKSVVFVFAVSSRILRAAYGTDVKPIGDNELANIVDEQSPLFAVGDFVFALMNIIRKAGQPIAIANQFRFTIPTSGYQQAPVAVYPTHASPYYSKESKHDPLVIFFAIVISIVIMIWRCRQMYNSCCPESPKSTRCTSPTIQHEVQLQLVRARQDSRLRSEAPAPPHNLTDRLEAPPPSYESTISQEWIVRIRDENS